MAYLEHRNPKGFHLDLNNESRRSKGSHESELHSLQEQINSLEISVDDQNEQRKHRSTVVGFLRSVDKTEKEIQALEKTISGVPSKKNVLISHNLLSELQAELIQIRQSNYKMSHENERLRKKIQFKEDCAEDLVLLKEDYKNLVNSFKRSENIRKKQKGMIEGLKGQLGTMARKSPSKKKVN